ncbi:hypothetical protein K7432_003033 [Basidiobolus ranarum]|uniref:Uncharacterized protein n=1 Tax=Basidiobolus ranarum TaxID=34480 RepID=A0ABR2W710_9FUNG
MTSSKQPKGWLRQRIQAIIRNSGFYYSEEILFSIILCLVSGNKHLIIRASQDVIPALKCMIEEIAQEALGLSQATIHCTSTTTLADFTSNLLNKSRESVTRPRTTSLVRSIASTHKTLSGGMPRGTSQTGPDNGTRKNSLLVNDIADRRGRSVSVGEKILEETKSLVYRNKAKLAPPQTDLPLDKDTGDLTLIKDQISVSFKEPFKPEYPLTHNTRNSSEVTTIGFIGEPSTITNMSPTSSNRRYRPLSSDFKGMDPLPNPRRASSSIYTNCYSQPLKRVANMILIEGTQDSNTVLNAGIAELLNQGWFVESNIVHHLPDPCVAIMLLPVEVNVSLPRNIFFLNFSFEGEVKQKPRVYPKRIIMLNYHEIREISHKMKHIKISSEINRYVKDIILNIRMNNAFRSGLNTKASADLITAAKYR